MNKFIPAITLITLLGLQFQAEAAWSSRSQPQSEEKPVNTEGFNVVDNRSAFVELDYLFWKPYMEDSSFAVKSDSPILTLGTDGAARSNAKIKQPSYKLSSGVRLGFGGYSADRWDYSLRGTYLYSQASKHVHASATQVVSPEWFQTASGVNGSEASGHWRLNFGLLDFVLGREYFLTKRFAVHPIIGLRGALINQTNNARYTATFDTTPTNTRFRARNNIWGVGPRAGFDLNFYVARDWAFVGGLAGSLLYAHYSVYEKYKGQLAVVDQIDLSSINLKVKDSSHFGRANLDAYFGFGWNHWFCGGKRRVAISLSFEAQQWFNLNQEFQIDLVTVGTPNVRTHKNHGDLSLVGGTVHAQFDF